MKRLRTPLYLVLLALMCCVIVAPAPHTGTGYYPVLGGVKKLKWLLRDEFSVTLPAGSVNGTLSDSGHVRTVVDTESKLSLASGALTVTGGKTVPAFGDPAIQYGQFTKVAGTVLIVDIASSDTTKASVVGFAPSTAMNFTGSAGTERWCLTSTGLGVAARIGTLASLVVGPVLTNNIKYKYAMLLRNAGVFVYVKGGVFTNYTLLYEYSETVSTTLYPGISILDAPCTSSFLRIPDALYLPVPLLSDGFGSAFGTSDGLGHAEGIAGGIGAGGGGVAWTTQLGTISISSGKAIATGLGGAGSDRAIATVPVGTAYTLLEAALTKGTTGCGVVTHYTDVDNYQYCWHNGTNLITVERLAGTETSRISAAATYSAGKKVVLTTESATTMRAYYNDALIGTSALFNNSLIAQNVGIIFFDTDSTIDNIVDFAKGNEGQHNYLDKFSGD